MKIGNFRSFPKMYKMNFFYVRAKISLKIKFRTFLRYSMREIEEFDQYLFIFKRNFNTLGEKGPGAPGSGTLQTGIAEVVESPIRTLKLIFSTPCNPAEAQRRQQTRILLLKRWRHLTKKVFIVEQSFCAILRPRCASWERT